MEVTCTCGTKFQARSAKARYCSDRCRKRKGKTEAATEAPAVRPRGPIELAAASELAAAGRLNTTVGQQCLTLARRLDWPSFETGSGLASVSRELSSRMSEAMRGGGAASAPQQIRDELAERRVHRGA